MGKTITSIVIMSAVTLSIAAAAVGIHAMNRNPAADDGSGTSQGGDTGRSVVRIEKTKTMGLVDEYTIFYSDNTTSRFFVTNGASGMESIQGMPGKDGKTPAITVGTNGNWCIDGVDQGIRADVKTANDMAKTVTKIEKTNTYGTVDEYTITYSDETTSIFLFNDGDNSITEFANSIGQTPTVTIGENGNWYVDWIDTGVFAKDGASGGAGADGKSAYQLAVDNGYTGTIEQWLLSLIGANGKSAYQSAVDNGFTGTEAEWLTTLVGADGLSAYQIYCEHNIDPDLSEEDWLASLYGGGGAGADGKSAYEIYVDLNPGTTLSESEWLESLAGHDGKGIASITGPETDGLFDTYTINYSDSTSTTFVVKNGDKGEDGASVLTGNTDPNALDGKSGDSYVNTETWEYFVKNGNLWESKGNIKGGSGAAGAAGVNGKSLTAGNGVPDDENGSVGDSYIDVDSGNYYVKDTSAWTNIGNIKGGEGEDGRGITMITLTDDTSAETAEYTITYSDASSSTFTIAKPRSIVSITKTGTADLVDTYTVSYTYGADSTFTVTNGADGKTIYHGAGAPDNAAGVQGDVYIDTTNFDMYFKGMTEWGDSISFKGADGKGITSITGPETVGLVDTYTINYSDSTTSTFTVTNGADGLDGTKVVSGSGAPATTTGFQEGDAYINTVNWDYYVLALNAGDELEWQLSGNIKGADGQDGTKLTVGDTDPSSTAGFQEGDSFLNTTSWDFFVLTQGATDLEWTLEGNIHNSPNRYTISFESNGGSDVDPIENVLEGRPIGSANKPTDPTKAGYFFEGWYTTDGSRWDFVKDVATESITLYARWGQLEVTDGVLTGCSITGNVEIPYYYDGQIITSVDADAFKGNTTITGITLPNTVATIGDEAFMGCTNLVEANLPKSLTKVSDRAFSGCTKLANVTLTAGLTEIGEEAFLGCSKIESIAFPKTLETIRSSAFKNCTRLVCFTYPDDVALSSIGDNAFENCYQFQEVVLPDSLTNSLGEGCFKGCTSMKTLSLVMVGFTSDKSKGFNYLFDGSNTPSSLKTIILRGKEYFSYTIKATHLTGCSYVQNLLIEDKGTASFDKKGVLSSLTNLKTLTYQKGGSYLGWLWGNNEEDLNSSVPASLESVTVHKLSYGELERYYFTNCSHLKRITLGPSNYSCTTGGLDSSVWGSDAITVTLRGCTSLEYLEMGWLGDSNYSIDAQRDGLSVLFGYKPNEPNILSKPGVPTNLKEVRICTCTYSNQYLMKTLPTYAFYGWSTIKKVTWHNELVQFGYNSFYNCGVEHVTLQNGFKYFAWGDSDDMHTFYGSGLVSITFPETLTSDFVSVNGGVFENCTKLESVVIPSGITKIGPNAFKGCSSLTSISIPSTVTTIGNNAFDGCSRLLSVNIPNSVSTIGESLFANCTSLKSVTLPSSMTTIPVHFFENSGLISFSVPSNVTSIGNYAFDGCADLRTINLPSGLETIGAYSFRNCTSLLSVFIPKKVSSIGNYAFRGCTSLVSLTGLAYDINAGITSFWDSSVSTRTLGQGAFYNCVSLLSLKLDADKPLTLSTSCFAGCTSLVHIVFGGSSTLNVGMQCFQNCLSLDFIQLAKGMGNVTFGSMCFAYCSSLSNIINSSSVSIGDSCFLRCTSLTRIKDIGLGTNPGITAIGTSAFEECWSLVEIEMKGVTSIGNSAFKNCYSLESITLESTVSLIYTKAFQNCTSLRTLTILYNGSSNLSLGQYAFDGCSSITTVNVAVDSSTYSSWFTGSASTGNDAIKPAAAGVTFNYSYGA